MLQSRILGDGNQWTSAVMTWSRLQGELADRRTTINTPRTAEGAVTKRREEERRSEEECDVQSQTCAGGQTEASGSQRSGKQNGTQSQERKRKRNDDEEEEEKGSAVQICASETNIEEEMTRREEEMEVRRKFHGSPNNGKHGKVPRTRLVDKHQATTGQECDERSNVKRMDGMVKDEVLESVGKGKWEFHFKFNILLLYQQILRVMSRCCFFIIVFFSFPSVFHVCLVCCRKR